MMGDWFLTQNLSKRKSPLDHDDNEPKKSDEPSQFLCAICFEKQPVCDMFKEGKCNHPFCNHCIRTHIATQIHQNPLNVKCPHPKCWVEMKPEYVHTILPHKVIDRWECARRESWIESQKNYCPYKNCAVLLENDGREVNVTRAECPSCHRLFCAQCKVPWHGRMTCKKFQRLKRNKDEIKFFKLAKRENWQKCPRCTMFVQRCEGCSHIVCRCGCNFCYDCGKKWKVEHFCKKQFSFSYIIRYLHHRTADWFKRRN